MLWLIYVGFTLMVYFSYNNVKAIDEQTVQFRTDNGINIGGLYFS